MILNVGGNAILVALQTLEVALKIQSKWDIEHFEIRLGVVLTYNIYQFIYLFDNIFIFLTLFRQLLFM